MSDGQGRHIQPVLQLRGIAHGFRQGADRLEILNGISIDIYPGELVGLLGPSGSGKSTLLHIAGLLETPERGEVTINGIPCETINDQARTRLRRREIGFIYQFHHLLPEFSALENVMLARMLAGSGKSEAVARAHDLLARMGLTQRTSHRPPELSGGEQQRVAIARALANRPHIVLADEPTGNLDPKTADLVFGELLRMAREEDVAALIATHSTALAARMDRTLVIGDDGIMQVTAAEG